MCSLGGGLRSPSAFVLNHVFLIGNSPCVHKILLFSLESGCFKSSWLRLSCSIRPRLVTPLIICNILACPAPEYNGHNRAYLCSCTKLGSCCMMFWSILNWLTSIPNTFSTTQQARLSLYLNTHSGMFTYW